MTKRCNHVRQLMVVLILVGTATDAAGVEFEDSIFADADWQTTYLVSGPGSASGSAVQDAVGNPGPARQVTHTSTPPAPNTIVVRHLLSAATYDPSVSGPIERVTFAIDFMNVNSVGDGHRFNVALWQDGKFYIADSTGTNLTGIDPGWHGHLSSPLEVDNFVEQLSDGTTDGASHPDFSASGASITFGFNTQNSLGNNTLIVLYDNYWVSLDVETVPGLGVGGLVSLAFLLLAVALVTGARGRLFPA